MPAEIEKNADPQAPAETVDPQAPPGSEFVTTARRGCLMGRRDRSGIVSIVKVDEHCDCSMDLANLSVKHASEIRDLLHAMVVNAR